MFAKRQAPGRRVARQSPSSDSDPPRCLNGKNVDVPTEQDGSNGRRRKFTTARDESGDDDIFQVKKSKLSRQMAREKTSAPTLLSSSASDKPRSRGRGVSAVSARRPVHGWPDHEISRSDDQCEAVFVSESQIVSVTDETDSMVLRDDDVSDSHGPDHNAGSAARLARARRTAAREIYGAFADAGAVAQQADYIPLVPSRPRSAAAAVAASADADASSPFDPALGVAFRQPGDAGGGQALEEADEADEWALQQLRVGIHRRRSAPSLDSAACNSAGPAAHTKVVVASSSVPGSDGKTPPDPGVLTPAQAMARVWETMQKLDGSVGERSAKSEELSDRKREATGSLEDLAKEERKLDRHLQVVQELEELSWTLGGLVDAKAAKVTQALQVLGRMERDFVARRNRRRARDIAMDVVHIGGASLSVARTDDDASGEDSTPASRIAATDARRSRREKRRQLRVKMTKPAPVREGWDSSSASEEDRWEELAADRGAFCAAAQRQLYGDVDDDFATMPAVLRQLTKAKQKLGDEYIQAYVPLSLPEALAPHASHSLLWWDPLGLCIKREEQDTGADGRSAVDEQPGPMTWGTSPPVTGLQMEGLDWFSDLATFTELRGDDDPDGDLVPKLVQRTVFPEVSRRLTDCWDIASARHSEVVAELLNECVLFEVDQDSGSFKSLTDSACRRLEEGLGELAPEVFVPESGLAKWYASAARRRLLWRSCKLARCALLLDGHLPDEWLMSHVLVKIFHTRIAPHLRAPRLDAEELAVVEQFVASLPKNWLASGLPPTLAPLRDALGPRAPSGPEASRTAEAAVRVLCHLGCNDEAQVLQSSLKS